jgi:hypothetical protein
MSLAAWLTEKFSRRSVARHTNRYLRSLREQPVLASRRIAQELLRALRSEPGPKVALGETMWGEPVEVPLRDLVRASGMITGGAGSGKSMTACAILETLIERLPQLRSVGLGVLDAKGELFDRAAFLLAARLRELEGQAQEDLLTASSSSTSLRGRR